MNPSSGETESRPFVVRLNTYLHERFPILPSALLSTLYASGAFAVVLSVTGERLSLPRLAAAAAAVFAFFLALRLADERKDAVRDVVAHPTRPVPRGLVTLRELGRVEMTAWLVGGLCAVLLGTGPLLGWLAILAYGMLMRVEFFAGHFLEPRPIAYALTHQPVMLVVTGFLHLAAGLPPARLLDAPLLLHQSVCLAAMFSYEVSRKLRAPQDESAANPTYGQVHGPHVSGLLAAAPLVVAGLALGALLGQVYAVTAALALPSMWFAARPNRAAARLGEISGMVALLVFHGALTAQLFTAS